MNGQWIQWERSYNYHGPTMAHFLPDGTKRTACGTCSVYGVTVTDADEDVERCSRCAHKLRTVEIRRKGKT